MKQTFPRRRVREKLERWRRRRHISRFGILQAVEMMTAEAIANKFNEWFT
jgi:hypothetical protein